MGFSSIGPVGLILLVIVALLLFGPSKLPELGRAFGRTLKEFKNGAKEIMSDEDDEPKKRKEVNATYRDADVQQTEAQAETKSDKRLPD